MTGSPFPSLERPGRERTRPGAGAEAGAGRPLLSRVLQLHLGGRER